jgi:hypothetical protein
MEEGNLSGWTAGGGGPYNGTGDCWVECAEANGQTSVASQERAMTGTWSLKMSVPETGAVRVHRWAESALNPDLYYSAWYYIPAERTVGQHWNIWQWISKVSEAQQSPFWFIEAYNPVQGSPKLGLRVVWFLNTGVDGPLPGQTGYKTWPLGYNVPIGQWFHIEGRYKCAGDFTGAVQVWLDGVEVFNQADVRTGYPGGSCLWSVDNYAAKLTPSPTSIYVDNATISRR